MNIPRPPLIQELITNHAPLERMERLVGQGADINARDAQGNTALHLIMPYPMATLPYTPPADWFQRQAGAGGWRRRAVQWLERYRLVQPQAGPTNVSVLHFVLRLGADPGATNALGRTPLHLLGANVWPSGAVLAAYREAAAKLIEAGASMENRDVEGLTPWVTALNPFRDIPDYLTRLLARRISARATMFWRTQGCLRTCH